jgi:hypothetical protein
VKKEERNKGMNEWDKGKKERRYGTKMREKFFALPFNGR